MPLQINREHRVDLSRNTMLGCGRRGPHSVVPIPATQFWCDRPLVGTPAWPLRVGTANEALECDEALLRGRTAHPLS
ncbi:hypothetical protein MPL3356_340049 [Mesorhizobium plurifarium]|uniref:Uncharacterized protein n=1 Tax=Mesorhizobium plurifarium TaxID=69974 RepID=A0A090E244_MESPL|nr:hypothetical protein MPL3356_340049 [Mesorhizobium plurifarium]